MAKGYEVSFDLRGFQIKTTVTYDCNEIEKHLSSFFLPSINHQTKVIGFDVEWCMEYCKEPRIIAKSNCATLELYDGHSCLIIQLNRLPKFYGSTPLTDSVYRRLLKFLRQPNVTFVGVGIKNNLAKLEKHYGLGIRNAVELGPLAAAAMRMPRLSYCGVDELAFVLHGFHLGEHRPSTEDCDWASSPLSKELAQVATVNVYSYYKIGSTLLQSNDVGSDDTVLVRVW
ncbi:protein RISC-INTERACTING CLEARING 3'-5' EXORIBONUCLEASE 2-like [Vicia villosa]|uniref:protein RISC-INTERACTING CLEARING 3'-5' EXORIBONUCLEASE 2-like n=1 Tax=Vicia villosa TaxID=3911 RepID=UPI00273B0CA1|nr:protein RISC-INTERACTING CLEARING 3'-5' EXORIBONUCLEASE 2-like [Vicia villosa]